MSTLNDKYWILQKQDSKRLLLESLGRTRSACETAAANSLDTTIADLKENGWKAIKVTLDYV